MWAVSCVGSMYLGRQTFTEGAEEEAQNMSLGKRKKNTEEIKLFLSYLTCGVSLSLFFKHFNAYLCFRRVAAV